MHPKCNQSPGRRLSSAAVALAGVLLMLGALACTAAPGDVDPTYGAQGIYRTPERWIAAVVPLSQGLLVVSSNSDNCCTSSDTVVRRLDASGHTDPTYGSNGQTALPIGMGGWAVAAGGDGRLLLGGHFDNGGHFVAALSADGLPDRIFDGDYILRVNEAVTALALQSDGAMLIATEGRYVSDDQGEQLCTGDGWTLRRLTPTGRPDATFGTGGMTNSRMVAGSAALSCTVNHLWNESDGRIVIGDDRLMRVLPNGSVDPSFRSEPGGRIDARGQITRLADGRLVVARTTDPAQGLPYFTVLSRYTRDGQLDLSFGGGGTGNVTHRLGQVATGEADVTDYIYSYFVMPDDGSHIFALNAFFAPEGSGRGQRGEAVTRFLSDGKRDPAFGADGIVRITKSGNRGMLRLVPQADGRLIVVTNYEIFRLLSDTSPSPGIVSTDLYTAAPPHGGIAELKLSRTAGAGTAIGVDYQTVDSFGAVAGHDYVATSGRVEWAAGDSTDKTISIQIPDRKRAEGTAFTVRLTPAYGNPVLLDQVAYVNLNANTATNGPSPGPSPPMPDPSSPTSEIPKSSGGSGGGGSSGPALLSLLALLLICARRRRNSGLPCDRSCHRRKGLPACMGQLQSSFTNSLPQPHASSKAATALAGILLMLGAAACEAAPGDIDPTYGTLGRSAAPFGHEITAIVPLPDDRLIVVSAIPSDCCPVGTTIQRLDRNGTPDISFGNGGAAGVEVGAQAYGAALRSNGGLLLRGQFEIGGGFVAALTADGRPDPIFAGEYIRRVDTPVTAVASQPDGSTIYASDGMSVFQDDYGPPTCQADGWTLRRLTPAGQPDSTFGTNGVATSRDVDGAVNLACSVRALWVDDDGRIIVWGSTLRRLSANGSVDDSFGQTPSELLPAGTAVTHLQDGSFLVARPLSNVGGTVVYRLDSNGNFDPSFGPAGTGSVTLPDGTWSPLAIAAQLDGTFFYVALRSASPSRVGTVVVRLKANGQMDRSFGQDGAALVSHSTGILADIAAQKTGSLVVANYKNVYRLKDDDSPSPGAISIKKISAPIGSSDAQVVLGRTAGFGTAIAIEYRTVDNGAIAGRDYVASVGRLEWAAGDARDKTIAIGILPNPDSTSFRQFSLQLAPASGGPVMLDQEATIWIEPSQPASAPPIPPPATTPPAPGSTSGQHSGGGGGGSSGPALLSLLALLMISARRRQAQLSLADHH